MIQLYFVLVWLCFAGQHSFSLTHEGTALESLAGNASVSIEHRRQLAEQKCVKWGNTFDVSLTSHNLIRSCRLPDNRPICCSAVDPVSNDPMAKGVGYNYRPPSLTQQQLQHAKGLSAAKRLEDKCTLTKKYVPSPQELRDLEMAKQISRISSDHTDPQRLQALVSYVYSAESLRNASQWLARVKLHMSSEVAPPVHAHDLEFLSRFEFTRRCAGGVEETWTEWIEPLTIHARHPHSFGSCRPVQPLLDATSPRTGRSNVDYVLLQSGKSLFQQNHGEMGRRVVYHDDTPAATTSGPTTGPSRRSKPAPLRHFLLDAGTSTFDSSLFWFTCAYAQRAVGFDQVFAWEMTLLEPTDYWRRVPPKWKPYWHFYNVPIAADMMHGDSPLRFVAQLARPADFVAFKLDIDHPDLEMPLALQLLAEDGAAQLVDEFFFELHFRCEVMTSCGWGKRVPAEAHGLVLDRPQVLDFFAQLRRKGIRAHIWP